MAILTLNNVTYQYRSKYQTVEAVKNACADFEEGQISAIVGKSGSGKTTLLSLMAGLALPTEGSVLFCGTDTANMDPDAYRREKAAVIYQSFRLFPLLTAAENIMYPMELRKLPAAEARKQAVALLGQVDLPESLANRFPSMCSGGEQQRIAIARSLAMDTKLILADEPTGNLDTASTTLVIDILRRLAHEQGYCVIVVTHDTAILDRMDAVWKMRDGVLSREADA